jgi:hypothetical protein
MSWQFLLIPFLLFWFVGVGRHRRRLGSPRRRDRESSARDTELVNEVELQRSYITELELRVAELENRLDFTERLLAGRPAENPATSH